MRAGGSGVSAVLEKTKTPGIYRRGRRYVVTFRDQQGVPRKRSAASLAQARELKATLTADVKRGNYRPLSKLSFADYAKEWIQTYQGRTARGIRPETLADYRRDLGLDPDGNELGDGAIAHFGRMPLAAIEPRDIKRYAQTLAERGLSPSSVRNYLAPVRVLLATAYEDGLIQRNPAAGLRISQRTNTSDAEPKPKALTEAELRAFLDALPGEWRLFFEFLAQTGLRIGEAIALTWNDLDPEQRRLHVRRRIYRGRSDTPKSRYGRRTIPLTPSMTAALGAQRGSAADEAPLFPSQIGSHLDPAKVFTRILKPAAGKAGVPWAGFHTLRHTCGTMLFRHGFNAKQVQIWLGHHSPAFTLATYVHLLADDLPNTDFLDQLTAPEARQAADVVTLHSTSDLAA
jgi:integrase